MNPTPDENLGNTNLLTSVLTTVPSTSVGLAQEMLMSCVEKLTEPQIHDLLKCLSHRDASHREENTPGADRTPWRYC